MDTSEMYRMSEKEVALVRRTRTFIKELMLTPPEVPKKVTKEEEQDARVEYRAYVDTVISMVEKYYPTIAAGADSKAIVRAVQDPLGAYVRGEVNSFERDQRQAENVQIRERAQQRQQHEEASRKGALLLAQEGGLPEDVLQAVALPEKTQRAVRGIAAAVVKRREEMEAEKLKAAQQPPVTTPAVKDEADQEARDRELQAERDAEADAGTAGIPMRPTPRDDFWVRYADIDEVSRERIENLILQFSNAHQSLSKGYRSIYDIFVAGQKQLAIDLLRVFGPPRLDLPVQFQEVLSEATRTVERDAPAATAETGALPKAKLVPLITAEEKRLADEASKPRDPTAPRVMRPEPTPPVPVPELRMIVVDPPKPESEWSKERLLRMVPNPAGLKGEEQGKQASVTTRNMAAVVRFLILNELTRDCNREATAALFKCGKNSVKRAISGRDEEKKDRKATYVVVDQDMNIIDPPPAEDISTRKLRPLIKPLKEVVRPLSPPPGVHFRKPDVPGARAATAAVQAGTSTGAQTPQGAQKRPAGAPAEPSDPRSQDPDARSARSSSQPSGPKKSRPAKEKRD